MLRSLYTVSKPQRTRRHLLHPRAVPSRVGEWVAQTFNPSTQGAEASGSEFKASLVSKVSSRTARAIQRNFASKVKNENKQKNKKQKQKQ